MRKRIAIAGTAAAIGVAMLVAFVWAAADDDAEPVAATGDAPSTTDASTTSTSAASTTVTTSPSTTTSAVVPSSTPAPPTTASSTPTAPTTVPPLATYTGAAYPLTLDYPSSWQQTSADPTPSFAGDSGFFAIGGTASAESVTAVCQAQVAAAGQPFGSSPTIEATTVGDQEACLILPSEDQPADMRGAARVVARLPYELFSVGFNFLVLDADQAHVRPIAQSVQFLGHD
jgi:hypothetical protein